MFLWVNNLFVPRYVNKLERRRRSSRQGFRNTKKNTCVAGTKKCSNIRLEKGGKVKLKDPILINVYVKGF